MEVRLTRTDKKVPLPKKEGALLYFYAPEPVIIQSGELKNINTGLFLEEIPGSIFICNSSLELLKKQVVLLPSSFPLEAGKITLTLQNCGKSQVNILPNTELAVGRLIKLSDFSISISDAELPLEEHLTSSLNRKGDKFRFEIK